MGLISVFEKNPGRVLQNSRVELHRAKPAVTHAAYF